MKTRTRWVLLAACLAILHISGAAQQQAAQDPSSEPRQTSDADTSAEPTTQPSQVPVFRSGINFIQVDVVVTDDDGNSVTDLAATDFQVFEDGEPQTLEAFELVKIDAIPDPGAEPPRPITNRYDEEREAARTDTRIFVIFFDDYHVRFENGVRAGRTLIEFLQNSLVPTDLVGIMYPLMPLDDVRLTRNHGAIIEAVENFFGRKYDYQPRNSYEELYAYYPTDVVERIRNDVSLSALKGLMIHLGGVREGRKNVLLVSEGYTNYVPPELRDANANYPSLRPQAPSNSRIEETIQFFSDSTMELDLRELYSVANRFNTTIYAIDPRGLAATEYDMSQRTVNYRIDRRVLRRTQDTLRILAEQTDGRALINQNDLRPGLEQMVRDSSVYYLMGYNSSRSPTDGKFHEIEVRVNRPGVDVRHRQGFWAITERDAERALTTTLNEPPKAVDTALAALVEPTRGRLVRTWVGTARGDNGKTRVTFVWEPASSTGLRGDQPSRILVTAMGDTGGAYYRGRVPDTAPRAGRGTTATRRDAAAPPEVTAVEFDAAPGTMQLSLAVEGEGGEVLDRDLNEIEIPDFTGTDLVLSTPSFVRARTHLEWTALVEDWDAIPTAAREFRRTDRLLLRFEAYAPGNAEAELRARLLNRSGDTIHPLDVELSPDGRRYQVPLAPAHLPPGEYVIELAASIPGSETEQLIAFRLTS